MDGIYQVVLGGNNANAEYGQNVCHYKIHGTSGSDTPYRTAKALLNAFYSEISGDLEPCLGSDVEINLLYGRQIKPTPGPTCFLPIGGLGTHAHLSGTFATACRIRIIPGGIDSRSGHWYVWGLPTIAWSQGLLNSVLEGLLESFAADLLVPLNVLGGTANFGTYTRKTGDFTIATAFDVTQDKATAMNKRTVPVL